MREIFLKITEKTWDDVIWKTNVGVATNSTKISERLLTFMVKCVKIILLICLLFKASTAIATAKKVFPVPAGPTPKIISLLNKINKV